LEEIKDVVASLDNKKAPGKYGITGEIYRITFETLPRYITAIYNGCLRSGTFQKIWKRAEIIPINNPGKENSNSVTKYRTISLINVGGKILEKLLINRVMHHVHKNNCMNQNQFGFTPQKSTTDAAMLVKEYVEEGLEHGQIAIIVSLDVSSAFDNVWWPTILNTLKEFKCPQNLYNLVKSYLSQRTAEISTNTTRVERDVTKGCPQGSCCGPGLWNVQYNSLFNLDFMKQTKAVAFADDLVIVVKSNV
jgi:hypothetical protein